MSRDVASSRRSTRTALAASSFVALALALGVWGGTRQISAAPAHAFAPARLDRLRPARACWVEYGRNETWGQVGTAGLTRLWRWNITIAGLLVHHPSGDVVVDVGNSSRFHEQIREQPFFSRQWLALVPGSNRVVHDAPEALRAAGQDPAVLRWVILSHFHPDHAGGLVELPRVPVLVSGAEMQFVQRAKGSIHVIPAHARVLSGRTSSLRFDAGPYENFDQSADLFGDGTIVLVPLRGHTAGSVGTFVNLSPTRRYFHVGDAVNVMEAVERRLGKSLVMAPSDQDRALADKTVARIAQLHERDPSITILPAHDRDAWQRAFGAPNRCSQDPAASRHP